MGRGDPKGRSGKAMSAKVPLKIAVATSGHTAAVKDGTIPIEGVEANFVEVVPIIAAFRRMVRDVEFDVCEMAPTTYLIARARGGRTPAQNYPELIPNVAEVEADWYRRTGIYPIHGTIVVKTDVLEKNPKVGRALFEAFSKAKAPYLERLKRGEGQTPEDIRYRGFIHLMGDPLPYGMAANRDSIDALMT